jgi:DNA-binding response OmpR family regulator
MSDGASGNGNNHTILNGNSKILIVEDEVSMLRALEFALGKEGHLPTTARNGSEAMRSLFRDRPDLVLLDVMMPQMDGWETCRQMREVTDVPIIMLTARGGEEDIVKGLDCGADDYVVKPFRMLELMARVRAALRRASLVSTTTGHGQVSYDEGRFVLDIDRRLVITNGEPRTLSATEFRMLSYLVANAGRVLSNEQLLEHVWGPEYINETDYVKVYIRLLRNRVEPDSRQPRYILGRRGLGYFFDPRPQAIYA